MIGNRYSHGQLGYTILEQGDINRNTLQLDVSAWLVCRPDGEVIGSYPSMQAARDAIDQTTSNLAKPQPRRSGFSRDT